MLDWSSVIMSVPPPLPVTQRTCRSRRRIVGAAPRNADRFQLEGESGVGNLTRSAGKSRAHPQRTTGSRGVEAGTSHEPDGIRTLVPMKGGADGGLEIGRAHV